MIDRLSKLAAPKRQRAIYWAINIVLALGLFAFALRAWF